MTLSPTDNRRVRGVAAERYPLNAVCAHPECSEPAHDPHHAFRRSLIAGDSWFVAFYEGENGNAHTAWEEYGDPIPHVVGLCRHHHDLVTRDEAWIKLENDEFVWYDRGEEVEYPHVEGCPSPNLEVGWLRMGALDPQPAGREKVNKKPKRRALKGEARRKRKTVSIRVPQDEQEDGAGILTDLVEQFEDRLGNDPRRPPYYTLVDALSFALTNVGEDDV